MRVAVVSALAVLVGITACASPSNGECIGSGCTEKPAGQSGSYLSSYRQGVYNLATAPGGSCERACCEMPGGEYNVSGVWDAQTQVCAYHAQISQLRACENWCHEQTAGLAEAAEQDTLESIEQDFAAGGGEQNGTIATREHMGAKTLVLEGMVVAVTLQKDPSPVQSLELAFTRDPGLAVVRVHISPKRVRSSDWKYLRCHDVGLSVGDDWSAGGAKGSDGSWLRFESVHDGQVLEGGTSAIEIVSFTVDDATLREWATATVAGGQICLDKFALAAGQKALILELLAQ